MKVEDSERSHQQQKYKEVRAVIEDALMLYIMSIAKEKNRKKRFLLFRR